MVVKTEKTETKKTEEKTEPKVMKLGLNLEKTLLLVGDLHKKAMQRAKLNAYAEKLEAFELKQTEEDLTKSHYSGCNLTLVDDNRQSFELKNAVIIGEVCQFLKKKFEEKASELEAEIVLP